MQFQIETFEKDNGMEVVAMLPGDHVGLCFPMPYEKYESAMKFSARLDSYLSGEVDHYIISLNAELAGQRVAARERSDKRRLRK